MKKKNRIGSILKADLYRAFTTPTFWYAIFGLAILHYLNLYDELRVNQGSSVYYLFVMRTGLGGIAVVSFFFSVLPYSHSFISDLHNHYLLYSVKNSSIKKYSISKILITAVTTFLAMIGGYMLLVFMLAWNTPLLPEGGIRLETFINMYQTPFSGLVLDGYPITFFLVSVLPEAFCYSFLAVFSLCLSTVIPNIFVVFSTPIIFFYISMYLFTAERFPKILGWQNYMAEGIASWADWRVNLFYTLLYYLTGILVFGYLFYLNVRRQMNGK